MEYKIYLDPNEKPHFEKYNLPVDISYIDRLESVTGADMVLTPLVLPFIKPLYEKHFEAGAMLVQIKRGMDLPGSIFDGRMEHGLGQMVEFSVGKAIRNRQRVLLAVGNFGSSPDEKILMVNQMSSRVGYINYLGAMESWNENGGSISFIPSMKKIPEWCETKIRHLSVARTAGPNLVMTKAPVLFDETDILRPAEVVKDFRRTLMALPGMGEARVHSLYAYMKGARCKLSLFMALYILTSDEIFKVPLLAQRGKSIKKTIRSWVGLEDEHEELAIEFNLDRKEEQ